jgi:glycine cleavage system protein P-like pyridoxal-binding family
VEEQFPRLLVEAVSKAERTGSKERIDRLSLIIVHTVVEGPTADLEEVDEMMRLTLDISDADIDVLGKIYAKQAQGLSFLKYMPDQNVANSTWKELEDTHPIFKSSEIYSICAKLQSFGLATQVPRIPTTLGLTSMPYAILKKGADYLEAIKRV